jgi:signal transduction histidine kinase
MPKGGSLHISTVRESSYGVINIRDTGFGIPADKVDNIFDPFFTTKDFGTGLGLAITQQVVLEHGGHITCESKVNQGTNFRIELPLNEHK